MKLFYEDKNIRVRRAEKNDVEYLKDHLKEEDINEIWASNNVTPEEALSSGIDKSIFCCTIENGHPIGMFGINPKSVLGDRATIWLLGSEELKKYQYRFVKYSRKFIEMMLGFYPYLDNYIDVRNKASIKWLKFCGAKFDKPEAYGKEQKLFRHFYFRRT